MQIYEVIMLSPEYDGIRLYDPKKVSVYKKQLGGDVQLSIQASTLDWPAES